MSTGGIRDLDSSAGSDNSWMYGGINALQAAPAQPPKPPAPKVGLPPMFATPIDTIAGMKAGSAHTATRQADFAVPDPTTAAYYGGMPPPQLVPSQQQQQQHYNPSPFSRGSVSGAGAGSPFAPQQPQQQHFYQPPPPLAPPSQAFQGPQTAVQYAGVYQGVPAGPPLPTYTPPTESQEVQALRAMLAFSQAETADVKKAMQALQSDIAKSAETSANTRATIINLKQELEAANAELVMLRAKIAVAATGVGAFALPEEVPMGPSLLADPAPEPVVMHNLVQVPSLPGDSQMGLGFNSVDMVDDMFSGLPPLPPSALLPNDPDLTMNVFAEPAPFGDVVIDGNSNITFTAPPTQMAPNTAAPIPSFHTEHYAQQAPVTTPQPSFVVPDILDIDGSSGYTSNGFDSNFMQDYTYGYAAAAAAAPTAPAPPVPAPAPVFDVAVADPEPEPEPEPEESATAPPSPSTPQTAAHGKGPHMGKTVAQLAKLRVDDLKAELERLGLTYEAPKEAAAKRLYNAYRGKK